MFWHKRCFLNDRDQKKRIVRLCKILMKLETMPRQGGIMIRTNLNTALIIFVLLLVGVVSTGLHYHLEVERSNLEKQFQRLDNYDESVRKRVDFIQELHKNIKSNLEKFNSTLAEYEAIVEELEDEDSIHNSRLNEFANNSASMKEINLLKNQKLEDKIIVLQNTIERLEEQQNQSLNNLFSNITALGDSISIKARSMREFIQKYGTRKMKKNLEKYRDEPAQIEITGLFEEEK